MKKNFLRNLMTAGSLFVILASVSCKKDDKPAPIDNSISGIVASNPDFTILNAGLVRAGLVEALAGGSLTVFAPDDDAFAASGITLDAINTMPVATLDSILKYHVVGAQVPAASVPASDAVTSLLGTSIFASSNVNGVFVNGIAVKTADVAATNGIIHIIEKVLIPPTQTIAGILAGNPDYTYLVAAVIKAGLLTAVSSPGKYTVFAPDNDAFIAAGFATIDDINAAEDALITAVVSQHVITTNVFAGDLTNNAMPTTLQGNTLTITLPPARLKVSESANAPTDITGVNITATNGVIHYVADVLL